MRIPAWPPKHPDKKRRLLFLFLPLPLLLTGCALRVGPKRLTHERFDYSAAIATSWKEQMLTNLVKVRYADPPVFLDIAQVVTRTPLKHRRRSTPRIGRETLPGRRRAFSGAGRRALPSLTTS
jgi:hypothetical protein